jgi:hypothetical protein
MNKPEKHKEDLLKEFIYPDRSERAPEDFTLKVMNRVQMEAIPNIQPARRERSLIPYISIGFTLLLFAAALLIPGSKTDSFTITLVEIIRNLKISLPKIDLTSIFSFSIPSLLIYIFIGILVLLLFDRALYAIFHRQKSQDIRDSLL